MADGKSYSGSSPRLQCAQACQASRIRPFYSQTALTLPAGESGLQRFLHLIWACDPVYEER